MPTKKSKQKLLKYRACMAARIVACVSFLVLAAIGVSSLVRAMSLESIDNQNGIPSAWKVASLGQPETITVPITYWDQRQDACNDSNRQFEWVKCGYWTSGTVNGVVQDTLGSDGLPVPAFVTATEAWQANRDVFTANVTGHNPVQPSDNFYRWFHDTSVSKSYNREITFHRVGNSNTYTYGSEGVFPLDDVDFSKDDETTRDGHNYHFTAHMSIAMKVAADGSEKFEFSGDDDVWVFLNGKLVLDLGGLHEKLDGHFIINKNGSITSFTQKVNDTSVRDQLGEPSNSFNGYVDPLNQLNRKTYKDQTKTINANIHEGDVVNLDFFYAERSTTESNTRITISNMNWPISADSDVTGEVIGKVENTENNIIKYSTSVKNRDPNLPLQLKRISTYIQDIATETTADGDTIEHKNIGFLPHNSKTLSYTTTPEDDSSWQPVEISAPSNNASGFTLSEPITMAPAGQEDDTVYFRYFAETSEHVGTISNRTSYYTELNGVSGVTYDNTALDYIGHKTSVEDPKPTYHVRIRYVHSDTKEDILPEYNSEHSAGDSIVITPEDVPGFTKDTDKIEITVDGDIERIVYYTPEEKEPDPITPVDPINPDPVIPPVDPIDPDPTIPDTPTPTTPDTPPTEDLIDLPIIPITPSDDEDGLFYLAPLGEVAFVPSTGVIKDQVAPIFEQYFADAVLSQGFALTALLIFAGSFATFFSLRKHLKLSKATQPIQIKKVPKTIPSAKSTRKAQKSAQKSTTKSTPSKRTSPKKTTKSAKTTTKKQTKAPAKAKKS